MAVAPLPLRPGMPPGPQFAEPPHYQPNPMAPATGAMPPPVPMPTFGDPMPDLTVAPQPLGPTGGGPPVAQNPMDAAVTQLITALAERPAQSPAGEQLTGAVAGGVDEAVKHPFGGTILTPEQHGEHLRQKRFTKEYDIRDARQDKQRDWQERNRSRLQEELTRQRIEREDLRKGRSGGN